MSSTNVPCQNPDLCKVKTHRSDTKAACQRPGGAKGKGKQSGGLSAIPSLSSTPDAPNFVDGGPDPDFELKAEYPYDFVSLDERGQGGTKPFETWSDEEREQYAFIRQTVKDRLGLHLVTDPDSEYDGSLETYLVHDDGRYMMGNIGPDHVEMMLWSDFGDGSSLSGTDSRGHDGDVDAYIHHIGARFDKLCREYANE